MNEEEYEYRRRLLWLLNEIRKNTLGIAPFTFICAGGTVLRGCVG